jgi:hypothetical protein
VDTIYLSLQTLEIENGQMNHNASIETANSWEVIIKICPIIRIWILFEDIILQITIRAYDIQKPQILYTWLSCTLKQFSF